MIKGSNGKPTKIMAGLPLPARAPGNPDEHALACYPKSVFEKLEISLSAVPVPLSPGTGQRDTVGGYNPSFLSQRVPLPNLTQKNLLDANSHRQYIARQQRPHIHHPHVDCVNRTQLTHTPKLSLLYADPLAQTRRHRLLDPIRKLQVLFVSQLGPLPSIRNARTH